MTWSASSTLWRQPRRSRWRSLACNPTESSSYGSSTPPVRHAATSRLLHPHLHAQHKSRRRQLPHRHYGSQ
ncbi:uncharacterized protein LOC100191519 [Zea mays]|uniref:Uncharacterized protein n=1 Tax=Zea mays TaxID=4577 RepID=B4F931_MAIZE|nr:uncharacterized protein LOC100191519 [Zea mays]ACF78624.1 unknown [Zea mays]ACG27221.1 hypothetical protein [Zea mays]|eukprot:NP_001315048.1 uncharacterized protein LOC100191519 [Zea mays]